jgi:hypothetical protein
MMSFLEWLAGGGRVFVTYLRGKPQLPLAEECGGGKNPSQISYKKHQPGRLGTKEKAS